YAKLRGARHGSRYHHLHPTMIGIHVMSTDPARPMPRHVEWKYLRGRRQQIVVTIKNPVQQGTPLATYALGMLDLSVFEPASSRKFPLRLWLDQGKIPRRAQCLRIVPMEKQDQIRHV